MKQERLVHELYQRQQVLRRESIVPRGCIKDERYQALRGVLLLSEQQLISGRRDHARCERMLEKFLIIRDRIVDRLKLIGQSGPDTDHDAELEAAMDREFAQHLAGLMELAANHDPDDSEYSSEWRKCLQLHAEDLNQVIAADLNGTLAHYQRHFLANGRFNFVPHETQVQVLQELRNDFDFQIIKQRGPTAVCYASRSMQLALVSRNGAIRYIDMLDHVRYADELPKCSYPASADKVNPPSVEYYQQCGARHRLTYSWMTLRYV